MRTKRTHQMSIYEAFSKHEIGQELKAVSDWLDVHLDVLDWVLADVQRAQLKPTGRNGISIESILRCGILKTALAETSRTLCPTGCARD